MKKNSTFFKTMLLILSIVFSLKMNSQVLTPQINSQVEKCGSDQIHRELLRTNPGYAQRMQQYENYVQNIQESNTNRTNSIIYKVPVVVNVMHKGEAIGVGTNVSDEAIQNAIKIMNQMYRKVAGTQGDGNGVDVEIEYVLAVRDPSGNCTNGINRISMTGNSAYMSNGVDRQATGGISDAALKAVYVWDQNEYYNIWLISEIDDNEGGNGIQGYAYFASSHGSPQDGSVILSSNFTSGTSTTAAHEIGHSLNLYHTFQGDGTGASCPTDAVCGTSGDCCGDTPPHKRSASDCVSGTNSCTGTSTDLFIHNYMDYSSDLCQNMLTANQKTRMVAALTTTRASFLESNGNMGLVPVSTAGVDFESSASILCGTGQSVTFIDRSSCIPNSYIPSSSFTGISHSWTITNGTNTYTSSAQNPSITFTNTGTFNITLSVTNSFGTTSLTKTGMIVVTSGAPIAGCTPTTGNAGNFWQTIYNTTFNSINSSTSQYINAAYTNLACSYNTIVTAGDSYNLSISANAEGGSGNEVFEVYIDYNNNGVFSNPSELIFSGNAPSGTLGTFTTNVTIPGTATPNTLLRMRVIGETTAISATERTCGAALFIGDVEDYGVYILPAGCTAPTITGTTPGSRCGNGTVILGAAASTGTVNWYTAATGGTAIATGTSYTTTSISTTTTYYVDATNAGCTTATRTAVIATVNPTLAPSVSIAQTGGTNPMCSGASATFTSTPTNGGSTPAYQWKVNGGNVGTNSPTYTTTGLSNGQSVTCVLTSNAACVAPTTATSSAVTMTVNSAAVPSVIIAQTVGTNPMCSGASATFTSTPTNGGSTPAYQWKVNGGNVGTNSPTYTTTGLTNGQSVTCVLTSNAACAAPTTATSSAVTMTVNSTVVPSVVIAQTVGTNPMCSGASATFTSTPTNGGSTPAYQWKVNGGNVGTNSPTYTTTGLTNGQSVTCVLTSNANCAAPTTATSSAVTMTVNSSVVPSIVTAQTVGTNPMCSGASATFTSTPTNGGSTPAYQWKVNGGNVGTNSPTYTTTGLTNGQAVTCVLTSNAACAAPTTATSSAVTMTVNSSVVPSIVTAQTVGTNPMCSGASATFTSTPTNGGSTPAYQWKVNGGNVGTNSPTYTTTGLTNGQSVTCVLTSNAACAAPITATSSAVTMTVNSTVVPSVVIAQTVGTNPMCTGASATFTSTPTNGGSTPAYQWKVNGGNVGTNSPTYTTTGLSNGQSVTCVLTSNANCAAPTTATSSAVTMTVSGSVTPGISIALSSGSNPMCIGASATFSASPTNGGSSPDYQWQVDGGNVGTNSSTFTSSLNNGEAVICILTSNSSCASTPTAVSSAITATTNAQPTVNASASSTNVCSGSASTLTGSGATTYSWNTGASTSTISVSPTLNTTYTVTGSTAGCSNTDVITITVNALPTINVNASPTSICSGSSSTLTGSGGVSYLWNTGETTTSIAVTPTVNTAYTVTGTDASGCENLTSLTLTVTNCSGTTQLVPASCGSTVTTLDQYLNFNAIAGATNYKVEVVNALQPFNVVNIRYRTVPDFCLSWIPGTQYGRTYSIRVSAYVGGVWRPWGSTCTVTTPSVTPTTQFSAGSCGITLSTLDQVLNFSSVPSATNYRMEITNASQPFSVVNVRYNTVTNFRMSWISGIQYNRTYNVRISAYVAGAWGSYGNMCTITTPSNIPTTQLDINSCGLTVSTLSQVFNFIPISGATNYKVEVVNATQPLSVVNFRNNNLTNFALSYVSGTQTGRTYDIRVAPYVSGVWGSFGNMCQVTAGTAKNGDDLQFNNMRLSNNYETDEIVKIYPNPTNGEFTIELGSNRQVEISNILGEKILTQLLFEGQSNININDQPAGIYFVKISFDNKQQVIKIIKE